MEEAGTPGNNFLMSSKKSGQQPREIVKRISEGTIVQFEKGPLENYKNNTPGKNPEEILKKVTRGNSCYCCFQFYKNNFLSVG